MYNYSIDTTMLPKVWVTWESKKNGQFDKRYWLNCHTGEKKDVKEPWMKYESERDITHPSYDTGSLGVYYRNSTSDNVWVVSGCKLKYAYLKYHEDIDKFEIAVVSIDTSRKTTARDWVYIGDRYFVGKDKVVYDVNGNIIYNSFVAYKDHSYSEFKYFIGAVLRLHICKNFAEEFRKFFGSSSFVISSGRTISLEYNWGVHAWYIYKQTNGNKGKQQKLAETLTAIPLSDASDFSTRYPDNARHMHSGHYYQPRHIAYFERVNDAWSVLRLFYSPYNSSDLSENKRLYISDDGKLRMVTKTSNGWHTSKREGYRNYELVNKDEAAEKCKPIKYILESYSGSDKSKITNVIIAALYFPEIEQMMKLGYEKMAMRFVNSPTVKADIKSIFGQTYNDKGKGLLKKIGLNKSKVDILMSHLDRYNSDGYLLMQSMLGDSVKHLDDATFAKYLRGFTEISSYYGLRENHIYRARQSNDITLLRFYQNLMRLGEKYNTAYRVMADTISRWSGLRPGTEPQINWLFDDFSDLVRVHDAIDAIAREQEAERRALFSMKEAERRRLEEERRIKIDEERKKYEYEDERYIIRLPKDLTEVVEEGNKQRICIGGYTTRHATGDTNLFFLRDKHAASVPFYAIEMRNNSIVQIHGMCNKWLGNNPEAIPTVIRWLRKNNIQCDTSILTCTSTGYCRNHNYIPLPVVD